MALDGIVGFGTFELDLDTGELRKRGVKLKLQPKPVAVLSLLVRHAGQLVTQDALRRELWADDTFVDFERGLGNALWKLRGVLGDAADNPRFIETLPRKGYRFIAPVRRAGTDSSPRRTMIAVLPFDDLGQAPAADYLVEGLTEELITQLGRLNPQRLGVIARASAMRYKGTEWSVRAVGRDLGVRYLLLGSIRRAGTRLRVTAQLVQISDQANVWGDSYDRLADDMVGVQIDLAQEIVKALAIELVPEGQALVARTRTRSVEAYEYYLQGRYHWNRRTPESARHAIEYFDKSAAADPTYALSFAGLADCYAVLGYYGDLLPADAFGRAKAHASRALQLDADLAEPHSSLAFCLLQYDWDWPAAHREHLEAIRLNPNCAPAYHWYGLTLTQVGLFSEASTALRYALKLDPFSVAIQAHIGRLSYLARDFDRAINGLRETVQLDSAFLPARYFFAMALLHGAHIQASVAEFETLVAILEHPILVSGLACAYGRAHNEEAARLTVERLTRLSGRTRVPPYFFAVAFAGLGDTGEVVRYLEEARAERYGWLFYACMDPVFDGVRADPLFQQVALPARLKAVSY